MKAALQRFSLTQYTVVGLVLIEGLMVACGYYKLENQTSPYLNMWRVYVISLVYSNFLAH